MFVVANRFFGEGGRGALVTFGEDARKLRVSSAHACRARREVGSRARSVARAAMVATAVAAAKRPRGYVI